MSGVHNRIHTLRGEQFRHLQNLRGSRSHLRATNIHTVPSLPIRLLSLADPSASSTGYDDLPQPKSITTPDPGELQPDGTSSQPQAGPAPPKSWRLTMRKDVRETADWRSEALSLVFDQLQQRDQTSYTLSSAASNPQRGNVNHYTGTTPCVPSLTLLCLQLFITTCTTSEFRDEVLPYIPPHLKKDLIRFTAVNSPLAGPKLYALWEPFGHTDGELIVVGPNAALKDDHFIRSHSRLHPEDALNAVAPAQEDDRDWDTEEDADTNVSLTTLILLNTSLSSSTLLSLPPTLTHVALICLSIPIPLHRLPNVCPLLVTLDLSYNSWLGANFNTGNESQGLIGQLGEPQQLRNPTVRAVVDLGRVDWHRWNHLKVLGFRGNYVPDGFMNKVNEGRWDDVEVVL